MVTNMVVIDEMDVSQLSKETTLYGLLEKCELQHEIELTVCSDGALIMKCFTCPFNRLLDEKEEEYFRLQKIDL